MKIGMKFPLAMLAAAGCVSAQMAETLAARIAAHVRANDLRADVSFLASDALQGRATPSPGLDIAAEFIAAQFRRAGLEPVGDDGYFQTAKYQLVTPNLQDFGFTLGGITAGIVSVTVQEAVATDLRSSAAFKVVLSDASALDALTAEQVRGKVLVTELPAPARVAAYQALRGLLSLAAKLEPAMIVVVRADAMRVNAGQRPMLREAGDAAPRTPILWVWDKAVYDAVTAVKPGPMAATISAHISPPSVQPVAVRNVIGLLRGSDPQLKDTYLVITSHYDHLGVRPGEAGAAIYPGANDDASGTASLIAIAGALADSPDRPRRSVAFLALFGEEVGELGSKWYTTHPVFPLAKTIADLNLEQLGRTDDNEGLKVSQFNLTGFDYTDIADTLTKAASGSGVRVVKHPQNSDSFFARSDNAAFADAGVPSTTLSVSYVFPDYHQPGDQWQKLDYANLAKVDAVVALGILRIAESDKAPQWNRENPKTERYVKAHDRQ
jgi:hypothetical protein